MTRRSHRRRAAASASAKVAESAASSKSPEGTGQEGVRPAKEGAASASQKRVSAEPPFVSQEKTCVLREWTKADNNSSAAAFSSSAESLSEAAAEAAGALCCILGREGPTHFAHSALVDVVRDLAFSRGGFADSCFRLPLYALLLRCSCSTWATWLLVCFLKASRRLRQKRRSSVSLALRRMDEGEASPPSPFPDSGDSPGPRDPLCRLLYSQAAPCGLQREAAESCCGSAGCRGVCCLLRGPVEAALVLAETLRGEFGLRLPAAVAVLFLLENSAERGLDGLMCAKGAGADASEDEACFLERLLRTLLGRLPDDESPAFRAAQWALRRQPRGEGDAAEEQKHASVAQLSWLGERRLMSNSADALQIQNDVKRSLTAWQFSSASPLQECCPRTRKRESGSALFSPRESTRPSRRRARLSHSPQRRRRAEEKKTNVKNKDQDEDRRTAGEWHHVKKTQGLLPAEAAAASGETSSAESAPALEGAGGGEDFSLEGGRHREEQCDCSDCADSEESCVSSQGASSSAPSEGEGRSGKRNFQGTGYAASSLDEADVLALRETLGSLLTGLLARHEPLLLYTQGLHDVVSAILVVLADAARKFIWARHCLRKAFTAVAACREGEAGGDLARRSSSALAAALKETEPLSWRAALGALLDGDESGAGLHLGFALCERVALAFLGDFLSKPFEHSLVPAMRVLAFLLERRSPALCSLLRVSSAAAAETPGGEVLACVPWVITLFAHSPGAFDKTARLLDAVVASHPRFVLHLAAEVVASRRRHLNRILKEALEASGHSPAPRQTGSRGQEEKEAEQSPGQDGGGKRRRSPSSEPGRPRGATNEGAADAELHAELASHPEKLEVYRQLLGDRVSGEVHASLHSIRLESLSLERLLRRARRGLLSGEIQRSLLAASAEGLIALSASSALLVTRDLLTGAFAGSADAAKGERGPPREEESGCVCASLRYPEVFFEKRLCVPTASVRGKESLSTRYVEAVAAEQRRGEEEEGRFHRKASFCREDAPCRCFFLKGRRLLPEQRRASTGDASEGASGATEETPSRQTLFVPLYLRSAEEATARQEASEQRRERESPLAAFSAAASLRPALRVLGGWLFGAQVFRQGQRWGEWLLHFFFRLLRRSLSPLLLCSGSVVCLALFLRFCAGRASRASANATAASQAVSSSRATSSL